MAALKRIMQLIPFLPKSELCYANKYLKNRDFESLYEIVDSTIIKIEKNISSDFPKVEYLNVDLEKLIDLRCEVWDYKEQLEIPLDGPITCYEDYE